MADIVSDEPHEGEPQRDAEDAPETETDQERNIPEEVELQHSPQMDESDIAEMSMIAAQIESAEDFNLTFELNCGSSPVTHILYQNLFVVDTSDMQPVGEKPKSRRRSKEVSPLYVTERHEIEEFLEEGLNESVVDCGANRESEHIDSRGPSGRMGQSESGSEAVCSTPTASGRREDDVTEESNGFKHT
ncbi:unnamed protein product [Strongylus vulgaris]|uniref:Uncharacterized protein n=1 Tax=Strongylus vulgaris TaxID=40348 RepID=A0A3P7J968_STRVU|nr:unnamed protein product [Strongylus vulgaris]